MGTCDCSHHPGNPAAPCSSPHPQSEQLAPWEDAAPGAGSCPAGSPTQKVKGVESLVPFGEHVGDLTVLGEASGRGAGEFRVPSGALSPLPWMRCACPAPGECRVRVLRNTPSAGISVCKLPVRAAHCVLNGRRRLEPQARAGNGCPPFA